MLSRLTVPFEPGHATKRLQQAVGVQGSAADNQTLLAEGHWGSNPSERASVRAHVSAGQPRSG